MKTQYRNTIKSAKKAMEDGGFVRVADLRQAKAELLDEARAILDDCETERRTMTGTERREHDERVADARELNGIIERADIHNDEQRDAAAKHLAAKDGNLPDDGRLTFRDQSGNLYRSIKHGESFRTAIGAADDNMRAGRMIYGAATGDWQYADEEKRAYNAAASANGGYTLTTAMSARLIDLARARSVMSRAGATVVPLPDGADYLRLVVVETDPTAAWVSEGSLIPESTGTFGALEFRARTLAVFCKISLQLFRDSANAADIIENTIASAIALKLDESALNGTGAAEEPVGLLHSSNVTDSAAGGVFSYDKFLTAAGLCWAGDVEPTSVIQGAPLRTYISKLKDGEGRYAEGPPEWRAMGKYTSTQIGSTDSNATAYVGSFENAIFALRSGIEIEMSGVADDAFQRGQIFVRGMLRGDFAVGRSGDIVKLSGITGT